MPRFVTEIRNSLYQRSAGVTLAYAGSGFDLQCDLAENILLPGAGMDSPPDETYTYRLRCGVDTAVGALNRVESVLYYNTVDHLIENHSLHPVGAMTM